MHYILFLWHRSVAELFLEMGCTVSVVVETASSVMDSLPIPFASRIDFHVVDDLDSVSCLAHLAGEIQTSHPQIDGVYNFTERTQYAATVLAGFLGIDRGFMALVQRTRDKRIMKQTLALNGVPVAKYVPLPGVREANVASQEANVASQTEIAGFVRIEKELGLPAIVKPVDGRSSKDIWLIASETDFRQWLASSRLDLNRQWMAEEFIDGDEYHIDTIWVDGLARYCFVGRYEKPPRLVSFGNGTNATVYLARSNHEDLYRRAEILNNQMAAAIGIQTGVTHAEFFRTTSDRFVLGEVATRAAGGAHDDCIRVVVGEGLKQLGARALLGAFDGAPSERLAHGRTVGFVNLCPSKAGVISKLPSHGAISNAPGVVDVIYFLNEGDVYERGGACSWCVTPIVEAESAEACYAMLARLRHDFTCEV